MYRPIPSWTVDDFRENLSGTYIPNIVMSRNGRRHWLEPVCRGSVCQWAGPGGCQWAGQGLGAAVQVELLLLLLQGSQSGVLIGPNFVTRSYLWCRATAAAATLQPESGSTLGEYWVNTGWILGEYWLNIGWILAEYWVNTGWTLGEHWLNTGWILAQHWVNSSAAAGLSTRQLSAGVFLKVWSKRRHCFMIDRTR